jgi:hypothetical protein
VVDKKAEARSAEGIALRAGGLSVEKAKSLLFDPGTLSLFIQILLKLHNILGFRGLV